MASLAPFFAQFFDNNGDPLVGGKLFTYAAGTTTPQAIYTDSTGISAQTNPAILNARGEVDIWLSALPYKFVLTAADGSPIRTIDNVQGQTDVAVSSQDAAFAWVNAAAGQYWSFSPPTAITARPANVRWVLRCLSAGDGSFLAGDEIDVTYTGVGNSGTYISAGAWLFWFSQNGVLIVKDRAIAAAAITLTAARWDLKCVVMTR